MIVGIVGLGLMGGSFGRLLVDRGYTVYGTDRSVEAMKKAILVKAITSPLTMDNVAEVDMLVIATYPRSFERVAESYLPYMKSGAILSDFCGNKRIVISAMKRLSPLYPEIYFVGGHPMAGREYSGIEHSSIRLFDGASMILVPYSQDILKLAMLKEWYISLGFRRVEITTADNHDSMIAYTSQLCHIVSNAFIKSESAKLHAGYSAGSYRDLTRVARLEPSMWSELMMDNKDKLTEELSLLIDNLSKYLVALQNGDEDTLRALLDEGNQLKILIDKR